MTLSLPVVHPPPVEADCQSGKCGACCREMGMPPVADQEDESRLTPALRAEMDAHYDSPTYDPEGPCFWYDAAAGRCKNYERRPNVCRNFEPGCLPCFYWRHRANVGTAAERAATEHLATLAGADLS